MRSARKSATALGAVAVATAIALTGCAPSVGTPSGGGTTASAGPVTQEQIDEAMSTPTTLTVWSWVPDLQNQVDLFEAAYPEIDVELVNTTGGAQHYPKLRAALQAGRGVPDVAQIEYQYIPSFLQTESLADLTPYGAAEQEGEYVEWIWNQVATDEGVWAVPQDSGPLGSLYRKDIFDAAGVTEPPGTWAEFAEAAQAVKDETDSYITNLPGNDASQIYGFFWQAGAKPFTYDGDTTVGIDLDSPETQKVIDYWQDLIDADLVSVDPDFTDEYYQGLARDKYASWQVAAWGPIFLQGTVANTSGKWRAGTIPQWNEGENVSGNWGGSTDAVLAPSEHKIAAYEFSKFINTDPEAALRLATEQFLFPTTTAILENPDFVDQKSEFYGGQEVNKFFAGVSDTVDKDFQWLPFMDYVGSSYGETLGTAIAEKGDMRAALTEWQNQVVTYAEQQGFTVQ